MLILDLWGISFHAVVVFGLGKNLLFKSILGLCDIVVCNTVLHTIADTTVLLHYHYQILLVHFSRVSHFSIDN